MWLVPERDIAVVLLANGNVAINQLAFAALFELGITPQTGVTLALTHTYALRDVLDDTERGAYHDNVWTLRTGVTFYFR